MMLDGQQEGHPAHKNFRSKTLGMVVNQPNLPTSNEGCVFSLSQEDNRGEKLCCYHGVYCTCFLIVFLKFYSAIRLSSRKCVINSSVYKQL